MPRIIYRVAPSGHNCRDALQAPAFRSMQMVRAAGLEPARACDLLRDRPVASKATVSTNFTMPAGGRTVIDGAEAQVKVVASLLSS